MKLYLKHLLRTIPKRPLQPLILVLAILLSVAVSALSLGIGDALEEEQVLKEAASYGSADITVRLGAGSDTRFLFAEEAEEVLGGRCRVAPLYELPILLGERTVSGTATELSRYGDIFPLRFTAYGEITEGTLGRVVLISQSLADEMELTVGDTLTLTLLNRKQNFTVAGIAADRFVGEHDILFDITAITKRIAEGSVFLSALGNAFRPAGALYIETDGDLATAEALELLAASPAFADRTLLDVERHVGAVSSVEGASVIVNMIILFTGLLSAAVTFSCFVILASQRREENAVFLAAGAKRGPMALSLYLEVLLFFAIGTPLGLLLGQPALRLLVRRTGFSYAEGALGTRAMLTAALIELLSLLLTVTLFLLFHRERRGRTGRTPLFLLPLAPLALLLLSFPFLPGQLRFGFGIAALFLLLVSAALATPPLVRRLMRTLTAREARRGARRPALLYATANTRSVPLLGNMTALVALLACVVLITLAVVASGRGFLRGTHTLFAGEYAIPGATERAAEQVLACPSVERTSGIYLATADGEERSYTAVAAAELSALAPHLSLSRLPEGDEVILSEELAEGAALAVGDTFPVTVEGKTLTLTVGDTVRMGVPMILFDAAAQGIPYNMLLISGCEGASRDTLLQELTAATASELCGILPTEGLLEIKTATFEIYIRTALLLLFVISIFSAVGIANSITVSYRERREEFMLYALSGMPPATVARMKVLETLGVLLLGLLVSLAVSAAAIPLMHFTLSATHDFLINLGKILGK